MKVKDIIGDGSEWMPGKDYGVSEPVVSILMPAFCRAKCGLFEKTVQSVLNQDFQKWELIIIDDASTDGTADLIEYFMKIDSRISCIRHRNNVGLPAISEYEGVTKAQGQYIAFIFDDNEWERDYLSRTISFMVRNRAKAAYGYMRSYYGTDEEEYLDLGISSSGKGINTLYATNHIPNGAVILDKEVLYDPHVGLYDPHVAMARVCDWGLWKRVVRYYEFFETGIYAGTEKGASRKDSLGNIYKMNPWVTAERENEVCFEQLTPPNFGEVEINQVSSLSTTLFREATSSFYQYFRGKSWYREEKMASPERESLRLRVLVLATSYDATIPLSFGRIATCSPNHIIKFGVGDIPVSEVAQADAVILVRNAVALEKYKKLCKALHIPCYFYIDDNFIVLSKENKRDAYLKQTRLALEAPRTNQFAGIFTSTVELSSYFLKEGLNAKVFTLEPSIGTESIPMISEKKSEEVKTLAYLGGIFRDRTFYNVVMPAVITLAQTQPLRIICPSRININLYCDIANLEFITIDYSLSLDLTLMRYKKYSPCILIHCGPEQKNNQYKTENALINAVQLGAVLVASNVPPYSNKMAEKQIYVTAENSQQDWFEVLQNLMTDEQKCIDTYHDAKDYCLQRYNYRNAVQVMTDAFSDLKPASSFEVIQRLNGVVFDILYTKTMDNVNVESSLPTRSLTEVPLAFTGDIAESRSWKIKCQAEVFSELGICFASYGTVKGTVRIGIWCEEGQLREAVLDMEDYVHDNWTYISFPPIEGAAGQVYTVKMKFDYEKCSAYMGVFEDATKRTLLYRITNRLKHPITVTDLLFADCR